ncbi:MAG: aconitate hydratase AcnA [Myxococcales bacterium]|nr:aconitate hydratase AcnA [Myxococcales bacterium]
MCATPNPEPQTMSLNSFQSAATLAVGDKSYAYHRLTALADAGFDVSALPYSTRVLLENLLRNEDGVSVSADDIKAVAGWSPDAHPELEIAFRVARVLLQDFTGVPAVVDLAAMRDAMVAMGGDPSKINPLQPADLVIDHSVQIDHWGNKDAVEKNASLEYQRNEERFKMLRWGATAFENFRVVPPSTGIVHQVNLEYLAHGVFANTTDDGQEAYPDTLVGTDSHTPMVNALGVVGWGVGGIEAEAAMLGQPITMLLPEVVGFKLSGELAEGTTATDLVLTVVEMLREHGVVGKFVEFFGAGLSNLPLPDRATLSNMAPEYGATIGFFPVDDVTLDYLHLSGRPKDQIALVEAYNKAQGTFRTDDSPEPNFSAVLELDMGTVVPSMAGPKRPQDRIRLDASKGNWQETLPSLATGDFDADKTFHIDHEGESYDIGHGFVAIASITSCTNTSNPAVLIAAGLVARKARELGITVKPWVKTSLAPGSRVVKGYLGELGLLDDLAALKFDIVGYGCTTCIGNSGPLPPQVEPAVTEAGLVATSVLSGNRNFEGRISPHVRGNYLASPPLVVCYAIAGTMNIDVYNEPLTHTADGKPVFMKDIWPSRQDVATALGAAVTREMFEKEYASVFDGDETWQNLDVPKGDLYAWEDDSTYIQHPPFFQGMPVQPEEPTDISGARCLAKLGLSVTTDHISPAGAIAKDGPAGKYLRDNGISRLNFNSFGSRRGNHEVMMRGTFANIRLRNQLAPGTEGGWTTYLPTGEVESIFDASMKYQADDVPLVVLAGEQYGTGSSRDWAAKGTLLLGVKAVIATGYERIHRSNLIGMGVLPLQFKDGASHESLGLTGHETFDITGITGGIKAGQALTVTAAGDGGTQTFEVDTRLDTPVEVDYYRHGGILQFVLRNLLAEG